ncbi:MAG TPA: hypothetical protein VLI68_04765 [Hanamia sp.]|nr:hypothetical protein [Hanamia sp.]
MLESLKFHLKPSIFESEKILILNPEFLEFETVNFSKLEIAELRYGIRAIKGYRFRIGRIYCIDIKSLSGEIIKIRLKSVYRVRRVYLGKKFKEIVEAILANYINDISKDYFQRFKNKNEFNILGNIFKQEGIVLDKTVDIIPWTDLGTKNYLTYYSLFSKANPNLYRSFTYLLDWNTIVLYSVSRSILKQKGI